jgi:type VI secretion system protein
VSPSVSTALPLTVVVEDVETGVSSEHVFNRSPVRVGRNALNELTLQAPFISLSHAVLRFQADRVEVIDLGSTNGVLVDGKRIEPNVPVTVTAQSDVRIASLRLRFGRSATTPISVVREQTQFRRATEEIRLTPGPHGIRLPPELRTPAPRTVMSSAGAFVLASPETPAPVMAPARPAAKMVGKEPSSPPASAVEVVKLGTSAAAAPAAPRAPGPQPAQESLVETVYPLYVEYRQAWRRVHEAISANARALAPEEKLEFGALLEARMPGLYQEEQFRAFTGAPLSSVEPPSANLEFQLPLSPARPSADQRALLQVFAKTYAGGAELSSDAELEGLLDRVSEVLEAFGTAFLELRKGQAEFGEGIAVRTVTSETPLRRARSPQELLRWLLDPAADGAERIDDLTGGFGEVMIHQVAMLGATRRGILAMLDRLDPKMLQAPLPWPARLWKRWQRFESEWNSLAEEEQAVRVVFGPEFARSYAMVMGGHAVGATGTAVPKVGRISGKKPKPQGGQR